MPPPPAFPGAMRKSILIVMIGVAAIAIAWRWRSDHADSTLRSTQAAARDEVARAASGTFRDARISKAPVPPSDAIARPVGPSTSTAPASATVVQPPRGTPLKEVLADLRQAADRGDPQAACRVGLEMRHCAQMYEYQKRASEQPDQTHVFPSLGERRRVDERFCAGVERNDIRNNAWRYLYQAAAAGNVTAMAQFAIEPGLDRDNPASEAEGWSLYRDHAQEFIARAVDAGDVGAAYVGAFGLGFDLSGGGKGVFRPDPYVALVYANAVLLFLDPDHQQTMQRLSAKLEDQLPPDRVIQAQQDVTTLGARMAAAGATRVNWPPGDDAHVEPATDCGK